VKKGGIMGTIEIVVLFAVGIAVGRNWEKIRDFVKKEAKGRKGRKK